MTTTITVNADIDPQEVYDSLRADEQHEFLLYNIEDLNDGDLLNELEGRGYDIEKIS